MAAEHIIIQFLSLTLTKSVFRIGGGSKLKMSHQYNIFALHQSDQKTLHLDFCYIYPIFIVTEDEFYVEMANCVKVKLLKKYFMLV